MDKLCLCFNDLALYRESIYTMIDNEFDAVWYIEDVDTKCKEFDKTKLKEVNLLHTISRRPLYWVKGYLGLLSKPYKKYLFLGSTYNLTLYVFILIKSIFYRNKQLFLWTHGWYGKESRIQVILKKWIFSHVDGCFVYGDYAINLMKEHGLDVKKLWPIHNSLDYDTQLNLRNSITTSSVYVDHFGNANPVLVVIGRLTIRKHLDLLFYAVSILKEKGEKYNVMIIGDGEDKELLQKLADDLQILDQIWFYGACYDEKANAELLYNADMCVVPGDIGLTAIHSMMFGVPCISHNKFCYQGPEFEVINEGSTGAFFEHMNVDSLAKTISSWFAIHKEDRDAVRQTCYREIDESWNPYYQIEILKKHIL